MNFKKISLSFKALIKILNQLLLGKKYFRYLFFKDVKKSLMNREPFLIEKELETKKIAIVLQGPYIEKNNFTFQTIKRYRKIFPESILILSTWSVPENDKSYLKKIHVEIIINEKPIYFGIANVNLQIVSTKAGIHRAKKLGADYVLKTRTDQRIFNPNLLIYLDCMLDAFPLSHNYTNQHSRLVACSLNTFKLRMYGISDMFLFGHIHDMNLYWDVPLDNRKLDASIKLNTWKSHSNAQLSEVFFCTNYLRSLEREVEFTLEKSLKAIEEHFVIVDQNTIDLFWYKYTYDEDRYSHGMYNSQLTFNDWLILHTNNNIVYNEFMTDLKIDGGK